MDSRTPSPKTPGPLGTNMDAADPSTPLWFRGDTPGPLGVNDYADPDTKMCRLRTKIGIAARTPMFAGVKAPPGANFVVGKLKSGSDRRESSNEELLNSAQQVKVSGRATSEKLDETPTWTVEDEAKVRQIVSDALTKNYGDVALAFAYTRDLRQKPENYYNSNLAIASDYLRARWETLK